MEFDCYFSIPYALFNLFLEITLYVMCVLLCWMLADQSILILELLETASHEW